MVSRKKEGALTPDEKKIVNLRLHNPEEVLVHRGVVLFVPRQRLKGALRVRDRIEGRHHHFLTWVPNNRSPQTREKEWDKRLPVP